MTQGVSTRVIAACCGLGGFAIAILAGMSADNPLDEVLTRAMVSMFGCAALGFILGSIAERTVQNALRTYIAGSKAPTHAPAPNPALPEAPARES